MNSCSPSTSGNWGFWNRLADGMPKRLVTAAIVASLLFMPRGPLTSLGTQMVSYLTSRFPITPLSAKLFVTIGIAGAPNLLVRLRSSKETQTPFKTPEEFWHHVDISEKTTLAHELFEGTFDSPIQKGEKTISAGNSRIPIRWNFRGKGAFGSTFTIHTDFGEFALKIGRGKLGSSALSLMHNPVEGTVRILAADSIDRETAYMIAMHDMKSDFGAWTSKLNPTSKDLRHFYFDSAERFINALIILESRGLSYADFQSGNVMFDKADRPCLVDVDNLGAYDDLSAKMGIGCMHRLLLSAISEKAPSLALSADLSEWKKIDFKQTQNKSLLQTYLFRLKECANSQQ